MSSQNFQRTLLTIGIAINTVIFILLSVLHFYWALGGRLWYHDVLPASPNGPNRMEPGTSITFLVGFALLLFALATAGLLGSFNRYIKTAHFRLVVFVIGVIFLVRAIGDFEFIGFFKSVKSTGFAMNDTRIFSPLCLFISLLSFMIFIFSIQKTKNA